MSHDPKFRLFPRSSGEESDGGWRLDYKMLERLQEVIDQQNGGRVLLEDIEAVLLALEPMVPDLATMQQLRELSEPSTGEEE